MRLSQIDTENLNDSLVSKILFSVPSDDLKKGDCILVFGSFLDWKNRMKIAINLYKEGRAPTILISGGASEIGNKKEALIMREYAINNGVKLDDVLVEDESLNTTENVLCSLLVLHRAKILPNIKRILVVSNQLHIRRCMLTLSKYMPRDIKYTYCYNMDRCDKERMFEEVRNTIKYIKEGIIDDVELSI